MNDERAYGRAAMMWLLTTGLVLAVTEKHFGATTADLVAWVPFALCLRSAWKWRQARRREP